MPRNLGKRHGAFTAVTGERSVICPGRGFRCGSNCACAGSFATAKIGAADIHGTPAENSTTILAAHVPVERFSPADYQRIRRISGPRLAKQLGILASGSTLLRQLRRKLIKPSAQGPRVLGIDDWAWRKGHRYGTILCDLERGKVVDLLPDAVRKVLRNRFVLILEQRSSAAIAPAYMLERRHDCAASGAGRRSLAPASQLDGGIRRSLVPHHRLLSETARDPVRTSGLFGTFSLRKRTSLRLEMRLGRS